MTPHVGIWRAARINSSAAFQTKLQLQAKKAQKQQKRL